MTETNSDYLSDIETLSRTELGQKYRSTYSSWQNMKGRRRTDGAIIHPEFEDFGDFLRLMGPRPGTDYSVDRNDPSDNEYSAEKCAWRDKRDQANNQQRTIYLDYQGVSKPISEWARELGQKPDTLRRRYHKGWPVEEILFGRNGPRRVGQRQSSRDTYVSTSEKWPWLSATKAEEWEDDYVCRHRALETRYEFFRSFFVDDFEDVRSKAALLGNIDLALQSSVDLNEDERAQLRAFDLNEHEVSEALAKARDDYIKLAEVKKQLDHYKEQEGIFHRPAPKRSERF